VTAGLRFLLLGAGPAVVASAGRGGLGRVGSGSGAFPFPVAASLGEFGPTVCCCSWRDAWCPGRATDGRCWGR